jgi:hypothetical protein
MSKCKVCARADYKRYRAENSDYCRAYDRVRTVENGSRGSGGLEPRRRAANVWAKRHPQKRAAHEAVREALLAGRLVRPSTCSSCGKECVPQGHHEDYGKPLVVQWLCTKCHGAQHRRHDTAADRATIEPRSRARSATLTP